MSSGENPGLNTPELVVSDESSVLPPAAGGEPPGQPACAMAHAEHTTTTLAILTLISYLLTPEIATRARDRFLEEARATSRNLPAAGLGVSYRDAMSTPAHAPPHLVQFGAGNFLRAFIDWMVQGMNDRVGLGATIHLTKATPGPFPPAFARQGYAYHVVLRGRERGQVVHQRQRISCISGASNAYVDFDEFLREAADPDLRVIVSNTTEAGIAWVEGDRPTDRPAPSFPGKLTQLLRARFSALGGTRQSAVIVLPCELVEANGSTLRSHVQEHARRWYGDGRFDTWLADACTWLDTLVDRIVPGHDTAERAACLAESGIDDELLVVAEPYHLLVLAGPQREDVLPLRRAGFEAIWTDDVTPYRTRKVRILNGGHTFMAMVGLGLGVASVGEALEHPLLGRALEMLYAREVLPLLPFPQQELAAYQAAVVARFANPFVVHKLSDIALNSAAKMASRLLPTAREYVAQHGRPPPLTSFALAALLHRYLYTEGVVDTSSVLGRFRYIAGAHAGAPREAAAAALASADLWGGGAEEIPAPVQARATDLLVRIRDVGMSAALAELL
jgi:tagaturonate reductase